MADATRDRGRLGDWASLFIARHRGIVHHLHRQGDINALLLIPSSRAAEGRTRTHTYSAGRYLGCHASPAGMATGSDGTTQAPCELRAHTECQVGPAERARCAHLICTSKLTRSISRNIFRRVEDGCVSARADEKTTVRTTSMKRCV